MENEGIVQRFPASLRWAALLVLVLGGGSVAHATTVQLAYFYEGITSPDPAFPGCGPPIGPYGDAPCESQTNAFVPEYVHFNQVWDSSNGQFFIDAEAYPTVGTPGILATAHVRTNIGAEATAIISYYVSLVPISPLPINFDPPDYVPVHGAGSGSVQLMPNPAAADEGSEIFGLLSVQIQGIPVTNAPPAQFIQGCRYVGGTCDSSYTPDSFTFDATLNWAPNSIATVWMQATASVRPLFDSSTGTWQSRGGAGEVFATVDPVFTIDPDFMIDGRPATDFYRFEYSSNLEVVPLPATALLFPTAMAAALGWRRRRRPA